MGLVMYETLGHEHVLVMLMSLPMSLSLAYVLMSLSCQPDMFMSCHITMSCHQLNLLDLELDDH